MFDLNKLTMSTKTKYPKYYSYLVKLSQINTYINTVLRSRNAKHTVQE